ncbi:MAG: gluconate 2-dehydrogenase subunit 3 family protein [Flavobacteriaceae bacterium]|nr:gluconate 2-dehydrogenase subunit 3 family protein [Bacteroidia bacterium]MBT8286578.1 gluconate 2-dehydrogenase subunit 3 family protein [Bacteroidia bacterium]NNF75465.1 gluconate 2-dehydrogenase subunit 3 family protein [Flavobacteriaceae bacterium]NNK73938.1 gluconate 2-dehydrogenase subunit 3 family protein [Flavobacteriaceae bacterium]
MKRREALKNIGLSTGFLVATPSMLTLLQSCQTEVASWTPNFLSVDEGQVVKRLVDIIIPKTDMPGAVELNVPEFIDKYWDEVSSVKEQETLKTALGNLLSLIKTDYGDNLSKLTDDDYKSLLDNHMKTAMELKATFEAEKETTEITNSELLNSIKKLSIWSFLNSEHVGENVLAYDPVPAAYYCGDLNELTGGKSWSLR